LGRRDTDRDHDNRVREYFSQGEFWKNTPAELDPDTEAALTHLSDLNDQVMVNLIIQVRQMRQRSLRIRIELGRRVLPKLPLRE
jgi:hypothetical protein